MSNAGYDDDYLSDRQSLVSNPGSGPGSVPRRSVPRFSDESDDEYGRDGTAPPVQVDRRASLGCWGRFKDRLRQYFLYHLVNFLSHYLGFLLAITATTSAIAGGKNSAVSTGIGALSLISICVDIYLLNKHYKAETYFPYCAAPHLLFMTKGKRVDPSPPPNDTIYFLDKVLIFWQGYIFVVIPYTNLATALDKKKGAMTTFETIILIIIIVQLCITLVSWVLFVVFYILFIFEMLIRFFCFFCCLYRPRRNTQPVPSDDHIFASHISDPIFYTPYEWLYENL